MSLVTEDGTGLPTAESYISVADATTYHTARGNAVWNYVVELLTLDVAPVGAGWVAGDTITGATSGKTCTVVERITALTYHVKNRTGTYTLGEVLSNGTVTADVAGAVTEFAAGKVEFRNDSGGNIHDGFTTERSGTRRQGDSARDHHH